MVPILVNVKANLFEGMESLIHQAFLHVEHIDKQVADGHYDLIGPDNEIILPQVWETMVKPDMSISMHMWPPRPVPPEPPRTNQEDHDRPIEPPVPLDLGVRQPEEKRRSKEQGLKEEEDKLARLERHIMKHYANQIEREKGEEEEEEEEEEGEGEGEEEEKEKEKEREKERE
jgi:type IV secretory pathway VirB10-like protein